MGKSVCILELAERYAIDSNLIGRSISFRNENAAFTIRIPKLIIEKNRVARLGIPNIMDELGVDVEQWGKINGYKNFDNLETIDVWVSAVLIECNTDNVSQDISSMVVNFAKKIVHALQVLNPEAIRIPTDDVPNVLCEIGVAVEFDSSGKHNPIMHIASRLDVRKGRLSFGNLKNAIKNANKSLSAPYELLDNANNNLLRYDWRASVLNCATAIEVMMKKRIMDYFQGTEVPVNLQKHVLKQADGFSKLRDLCRALSIQLHNMPNVQDEIMAIRHRVIHGGYEPTHKEAYGAYKCAQQTLKVLNVPIFEKVTG